MSQITTDHIVSFLSEVSFFSELSRQSLQLLAENVGQETIVKGQTIFKKGAKGDALFIIYQGSVRVHDNEHIYDTLEQGECFGEYALIDNQTRSASVTAEERSIVLRIGREHFLDLMDRDSGFAHGILAVMIKRHRELDIIQERLASSKKELEITSSKMAGLVNGAMDAIIMFDAKFRIVLTNPSANKLLENFDVIGRNVLSFFDTKSAQMIEGVVQQSKEEDLNDYLPDIITTIGSDEKRVFNEGTISKYGSGEGFFYTLILRDIEDRLQAEDTISLLTKQTEYLEEEIKELTSSYGIIASDLGMKNVLNLIEQVAKTDATVLITGETGTGKDLVARASHKASHRNDKPLIRINCGAIPTNLIESELFGHKKGAFTGATTDRKGRFLLADKGTIFLDEIGELPLELQPKLLRVIQEGEFDPVGSSETIKVDVRILAATHRDLLKHAQENRFREDLYYRLNVFPISIPPLRARGEDVVIIAQEMLDEFSNKLNKPKFKIAKRDLQLFYQYTWPGNVRELQNLIERAVIVAKKGSIDWGAIIPLGNDSTSSDESKDTSRKILTSKEVQALERENILNALRHTHWKISGRGGAAELLALRPTTLASKIKALGIERPI